MCNCKANRHVSVDAMRKSERIKFHESEIAKSNTSSAPVLSNPSAGGRIESLSGGSREKKVECSDVTDGESFSRSSTPRSKSPTLCRPVGSVSSLASNFLTPRAPSPSRSRSPASSPHRFRSPGLLRTVSPRTTTEDHEGRGRSPPGNVRAAISVFETKSKQAEKAEYSSRRKSRGFIAGGSGGWLEQDVVKKAAEVGNRLDLAADDETKVGDSIITGDAASLEQRDDRVTQDETDVLKVGAESGVLGDKAISDCELGEESGEDGVKSTLLGESEDDDQQHEKDGQEDDEGKDGVELVSPKDRLLVQRGDSNIPIGEVPNVPQEGKKVDKKGRKAKRKRSKAELNELEVGKAAVGKAKPLKRRESKSGKAGTGEVKRRTSKVHEDKKREVASPREKEAASDTTDLSRENSFQDEQLSRERKREQTDEVDKTDKNEGYNSQVSHGDTGESAEEGEEGDPRVRAVTMMKMLGLKELRTSSIQKYVEEETPRSARLKERKAQSRSTMSVSSGGAEHASRRSDRLQVQSQMLPPCSSAPCLAPPEEEAATRNSEETSQRSPLSVSAEYKDEEARGGGAAEVESDGMSPLPEAFTSNFIISASGRAKKVRTKEIFQLCYFSNRIPIEKHSLDVSFIFPALTAAPCLFPCLRHGASIRGGGRRYECLPLL